MPYVTSEGYILPRTHEWVKLTLAGHNEDLRPIDVRASMVSAVDEWDPDERSSRLFVAGGQLIVVRESPDEVKRLIGEALQQSGRMEPKVLSVNGHEVLWMPTK